MRPAQKMFPSDRLRQAILRGDLVRPDACSDCGIVGPVEGHHDDYSKPLDVRWLCKPCHGRADAARRRAEGFRPKSQIRSVRLRPRDLDHLDHLRSRLGTLGRSQIEIVSMAIAHLLATLVRDERVHLTVPEEREGER